MPSNKVKKDGFLGEHPTGTTAVLAACALMLVEKFTDIEFTSEEAFTLLGAVTAAVSLFTPRFRRN